MRQILFEQTKTKTNISELDVRFCGHRVTGSTGRETFIITLSIIAGLVGGFTNLTEYSDDISETKETFYLRNPKSYDEQFIRQIGDHYIWFNYSNNQKRIKLESLIERLNLQDKFYITINQ